jgi:peroxiredoxin
MALTYTPEPEMGAACPDFSLRGTDDKNYSRDDFADTDVLCVVFICNHCPYVIAIQDRLVSLGRHFSDKSFRMVAISSNDAEKYPDDSFENMKKIASEKEYPFPYLVDEDQSVAKAFGAVCTPDFFVYDKQRKLQYRGRLDDNWKEPEKVQKQELKQAINDLLAGESIRFQQVPSMGCSIKWKE